MKDFSKKIMPTVMIGLVASMSFSNVLAANTKEETVYSKLYSNGNAYKTIVSTHLKNLEKEKEIKDISNLLNIKNTNGYEVFSKNGNSLLWKAESKDIYYQGESKEKLPVDCKVEYELNGNKIEAKDLIGKSGKVKINIEYTNKDEHIVKINGKEEKMYTPFVVVAGTVIKNSNNKNIEVSNGKLVDDGTKTTIIGVALPGLEDSLGLDEKTIDFKSNIEITMDTTCFSMNNIINYITPKLVDDQDIDMLNKLDDVYSKVDTLTSSTNKLEQGTKTLKSGMDTYVSKTKEFNNALNALSNGIDMANSNYKKINDGVQSLNKNMPELVKGANQVKEGTALLSSSLETLDGKAVELQEGTVAVNSGATELKNGIKQIIAATDTIKVPDNTEKITELQTLIAANNSIISKLDAATEGLKASMTAEMDENTKASILAQITSNETVKAVLSKNIEAENETIKTMQSTDSTAIATLKAGLAKAEAGAESLEVGSNKLVVGTQTLKGATSVLSTKSKELAMGVNTLTSGVLKVQNGVVTLAEGSNKITSGLDTINSSTSKIVDADNKLNEGAETILNGVSELENGVISFNEQGISKIAGYVNGDVKNITERVDALRKLADEYNNFASKDENMDGEVKFISIIDSVK